MTLFTLAKGGVQPPELNAKILRRVADHEIGAGDVKGAVLCLEASLRFGDDESVQTLLGQLWLRLGEQLMPASVYRKIGSFIMLVSGAVGLGLAVGVLNYVITAVLNMTLPGDLPLFAAILTWVPFVAMLSMAGIALFHLIDWSLTRMKNRNIGGALLLAIGGAALVEYSIVDGSAIASFVDALAFLHRFESISDAIFVGVQVLFTGGLYWLLRLSDLPIAVETIFIALLVLFAVYYVGIGIWTAVQTTRWQRRVWPPEAL